MKIQVPVEMPEPLSDETLALMTVTALAFKVAPRSAMCEHEKRVLEIASPALTLALGEIIRLRAAMEELEQTFMGDVSEKKEQKS